MTILYYARVTERVIPGLISVAYDAWYKPAEPGKPDAVDTGGDVNALCSRERNSPLCYGERYNSTLAQVEK